MYCMRNIWWYRRHVDKLLSSVIDKRAPVKSKTVTHSQVQYMDGEMPWNANVIETGKLENL